MDYGRSDYRRSPEFGHRDFRPADHPQRSRSQTRLEPEFIPTDYSPYQSRPLDKSSRSKSLDHREALHGDEPVYFDDRRGVNIPIRQERKERNYEYDKDLYVPVRREGDRMESRERGVDAPRGYGRGDEGYGREAEAYGREQDYGRHQMEGYGREVDIPMERVPRSTRSTEWLDRRGYDDRTMVPRPRVERHSPKSISSAKKPNVNLNQSFDAARSRRVEQPSDYRRAEDLRYGPEQYRPDWREGRSTSAAVGGGAGGGHRSHYHSSYQHESHAGGAGTTPRRVINQQPIGQMSPPTHGAPAGPMGGPAPIMGGPGGHGGPAQGYPYRQQQYRRVKCCCFTFTWPPWSYEPTTAPQPIYRNI